VSIIFTGVEGLIDAVCVWEFDSDVEREGVPKVSEIENFLHPEVWTCEKSETGGVEKYKCFKLSYCLVQIKAQ
jgi:hypothetical protein